MENNRVLIIGSINIDHYHHISQFPKKGETIIANDSSMSFGGKGANQAIACAKFGADIAFFGMIGNDIYTKSIIDNFNQYQIDISLLEIDNDHPTGTANILVSENDNIIIVTPGANQVVNRDLIKSFEEKIKDYDYVLIQNEVDDSCLEAIIEIKLKNNFQLIYNPAPFKQINPSYYQYIDLITPNEEEYAALRQQVNLKPEQLVVTLGSKGVEYQGQIYSAPKVEVQDTTGAGDCFNGVLVSLLAQNYPIEEAIVIAVNAASYSTTKIGAQSGYLSRDKYDTIFKK